VDFASLWAGFAWAYVLYLSASTTAKMSSILVLPATKSSASRKDSTEFEPSILRHSLLLSIDFDC